MLGEVKGRAGLAGGFSSILEDRDGLLLMGGVGGGLLGVSIGEAVVVLAGAVIGGVASGLLLLPTPAPIVKLFVLTLFFS